MAQFNIDFHSEYLVRILYRVSTEEIRTNGDKLNEAEILDLLQYIQEGLPIGAITLGRTADGTVEILHGAALLNTLVSVFTPPSEETGPAVCIDLKDNRFVVATSDRNTLVPLWVLFRPRQQFQYEQALKAEGASALAEALDAIGWRFKDYPLALITHYGSEEDHRKTEAWMRRVG